MTEHLDALFDRFDSRRPTGGAGLVQDIANLLGARRVHFGAATGLLTWGLSHTIGRTPSSEVDRRFIARQMADLLRRFEPRLENVRVIPVSDSKEFAFVIRANVRNVLDGRLALRVASPRVGGGLGANVVLLDDAR